MSTAPDLLLCTAVSVPHLFSFYTLCLIVVLRSAAWEGIRCSISGIARTGCMFEHTVGLLAHGNAALGRLLVCVARTLLLRLCQSVVTCYLTRYIYTQDNAHDT